MQHRQSKALPDWLLERLALGELDAETAADVRRRLAAEGRSPDDIMRAVAASNREILARASRQPGRGRDSAGAPTTLQPRARPAPRRAFLWVAPLALAGAAAAVLMIARPVERDRTESRAASRRPLRASTSIVTAPTAISA